MDPMPLPDMVEIASGPLLARFAPGWGGRLTHLVHAELGDILATREALSPEEDRRILRRIDMQ